MCVSLITGRHFRATEYLQIILKVAGWDMFALTQVSCLYFDEGHGKTEVDGHFAAVKGIMRDRCKVKELSKKDVEERNIHSKILA